MRRRGQKCPIMKPLSLGDHYGMGALQGEYFARLRERGFSAFTIQRRSHVLMVFGHWCEERGLTKPQDITRPILERYQRHLFYYRKSNGNPLSFRTQISYLSGIQAFFRFLAKQNYILSNPASDLELPKGCQRLPRAVLTAKEAEKILGTVPLDDELGIRDRAILEMFYATGIRRSELLSLKLFDVDEERNVLMIREGKGKKDRYLPISDRALTWLRKYLDEVRPNLVPAQDDGTLFLTVDGTSMTPGWVTRTVGRYVESADLGKKGSCHLFRHTMATLMLESGADIRFIQQMLGHSKLESTEIYTHVSIQKLKEVYLATHPGAKLRKDKEDSQEVSAM